MSIYHAFLFEKDGEIQEEVIFQKIRDFFSCTNGVMHVEKNPYTGQNMLVLLIDNENVAGFELDNDHAVTDDYEEMSKGTGTPSARIRVVMFKDEVIMFKGKNNKYDDIGVMVLQFLETFNNVIIFSGTAKSFIIIDVNKEIADRISHRSSDLKAAQRAIQEQSVGWQKAVAKLCTLDPERESIELPCADELREWHILAASPSVLSKIDPNWSKSRAAQSAVQSLGLLLTDQDLLHLHKEMVLKLEKIGTSTALDYVANRAFASLMKRLGKKGSWGYPGELRQVIDMLEKHLEAGAAHVSSSDLRVISNLEPIKWHHVDQDSYDEWADGFHTNPEYVTGYENCSHLKDLAHEELRRRETEL